jgi:hypothetical protein
VNGVVRACRWRAAAPRSTREQGAALRALGINPQELRG